MTKDYLKEIKILARKNGGKCLSSEYQNSQTKLIFECSKGHRWEASSSSIKSGSWCRKCFDEKNSKNRRTDISVYQRCAKSKGGKYLEKEYVPTYKSSRWECKEGHQFTAKSHEVLTGFRWCKTCSLAERKVNYINKVLEENEGECLSKNLSLKVLKWRCKKGHEFTATQYQAKDYWCKVCNKLKKKSLI